MPRLFTVTVSSSADPRHPGDGDLRAALASGGAVDGDFSPERDDIYMFSISGEGKSPAESPTAGRGEIEAFGDEFLAGDPSRIATVCDGVELARRQEDETAIVILRKPGVMDPVEQSVLHALGDSGFAAAQVVVRTARRYRFRNAVRSGEGARTELTELSAAHLCNPLVDECHVFLPGEVESIPDPFRCAEGAPGGRVEVPIVELDDAALEACSKDGGLALDLHEMRAIQSHYRGLGREPTDVELETLAQTWSEHCCHKTFTDPIHYDGEVIENLLGDTIFAVTRRIEAPFCLSVFRDNAGVIALDDHWGLTFKVETHNHPSALEPYGGAGTGIGGVIRDTLGTGLGAEPILSTDVFCFGPLDFPDSKLPPGTLPPRRLLDGVVSGVRDYGNRMGIPTLNGAIHFHPGYVGNPLVFCGSLGLIPRDKVDKAPRPGDLIVSIGGRTGRDGIHGATFSSQELTEESETLSSGAVQIGNPIEEKKVHDALLRARDEGLFSALTDCGAGGFSSAVGEMAEGYGAEVELAEAPLKYSGLRPAEIWISEAQERMVLAVPPEHRERLFEILREEEVEGCVLGRFTDDGALRIDYRGERVAELSLDFLHDGRPRQPQSATRWLSPTETPLTGGDDVETVLRSLLSHPSIASKEPVIRQYDHEVQGRCVLRPLTGVRGDGPGDGTAIDPLKDGSATAVVACGLAIHMGEVSPYEMGAQAVDEAARNIVASGGTLDRLALLDNFAWGDVHDPQILGAAVECSRGAAAAALAYGAPFVSGKDSLHNVYRSGGESRSIPHTFLVSALSIVKGAPRAPSSDLKREGNALLLVGDRDMRSLAGSLVQFHYGGAGGSPATFDGVFGRNVLELLQQWIADGTVRSCHDLSDGGLAVAACEMTLGAASEGARLQIPEGERDDVDVLFGEAPHRFVVEVSPKDIEAVRERAGEIPVVAIGTVTGDGRFSILRGDRPLVDADVTGLRDVWRGAFQSVWPEFR